MDISICRSFFWGFLKIIFFYMYVHRETMTSARCHSWKVHHCLFTDYQIIILKTYLM